MPHITFVQVGEYSNQNHIHTPLVGPNVINLLDKTDIRQLIRLVYHSIGCIGGVSFLMHLAAAVETKPGYPEARPCVVVAGAREPLQWEAYPNHQYIHRASCLPCSGHLGGGCWKSRTVPLHDGDRQDKSLCELPVDDGYGQFIPKCMDMITVNDVVSAINNYMMYWEYKR